MLTYYTFSEKISLNEVQCNSSTYCSIGKKVFCLLICCFLLCFQILFLSLVEYGMPSVVYLLFRLLVHWVSWICGSVSIINFGKLLAFSTSIIYSSSFSLSCLFIPNTYRLRLLMFPYNFFFFAFHFPKYPLISSSLLIYFSFMVSVLMRPLKTFQI